MRSELPELARWLASLLLGGVVINMVSGALCAWRAWVVQDWLLWLFAALSLAVAGMCGWMWRILHRLERKLKALE